MKRQFVAYFWFTSFSHISLGVSVDVKSPNIEFHVPFGFVRVGWVEQYDTPPINDAEISWRGFGLVERYTEE